MATNRTLHFLGAAYGNAPVILNAHINGTTVFSGTVPTVDLPVPDAPGNDIFQTLFTANTSLFPTDFSGSYPVTISVANGTGVVVSDIYSNYMTIYEVTDTAVLQNASITGNTLTVGTVISGTIQPNARLTGLGVADQTIILSQIDAQTWTINHPQSVAQTTMLAELVLGSPGNATSFSTCYFDETPSNGTNPPDPRANITIDGVAQERPPVTPLTEGVCNYTIPPGSTMAYDLTVSLGNE